MKKKICAITLLFTLLLYGKEAYAIFDPLATIMSVLEVKDEVLSQVQEIQKFKSDMEKRIKQGYALATSCFKDPSRCDIESITSLTGKYKTIKMFPVMEGAAEALNRDLVKTGSKSISDVVRNEYIYHENQEKGLRVGQQNREGLNSVITNQIAILFAKGAMAKTRLQNENSAEIYKDPSSIEKQGTAGNGDKDSILSLQATLDLMDNTRLARILEMKGYMQNAPATAGLMGKSIKERED